MKKIKKILAGALLLAFVLGSLMVTGCTKYANEEQLQKLEECREAANSAEQKVEDLKAEKADLQDELSTKKDELSSVEEEHETVQERLSEME